MIRLTRKVPLGVWGQYDRAAQLLVEQSRAVDPTAPDEEQKLDTIAAQEARLELQRDQTWASYGEALRAHVQDAVTRRPGLTVPVEVRVDLDAFRDPSDVAAAWGIASDLLREALAAVPAPAFITPDSVPPDRRSVEGSGGRTA